MRHLNIDMTELELAFEGGFEMISYYLDLDPAAAAKPVNNHMLKERSLY